jgi:glycerophosphoryl diester phosphodiesterase
MQLIAHRGFADVAPENTVAAVEAVTPEADAVEVDIRRCGSGELVVVHDCRIDRVTGGHGRIEDHDLDTLRSLSVEDSGEPIPTFSAVVDALASDIDLIVELKESGLVRAVLDAARSHEGRLVVSSFDPDVLATTRSIDEQVDTAYISMHLRDRPVATALRLGCANVHLQYGCCLVPTVVGRAHRAGLTVNAWTIDRRSLCRLLGLVGVDGIIADDPAVGTV